MKNIDKRVREGKIQWSCLDCAAKHRLGDPYEGTYTYHTGVCEICGKNEIVTSAKKLFGLHIFM